MKLFEKQEDKISLSVSVQTYIEIALLTLLTLLLVNIFHKVSHAIFLIFSAFFLALSLNAPVHWISSRIPGKRKGSRAIATTISYLIVIIFIGSFISYISPPLIKQTQNLISSAPSFINDIHNSKSPVGSIIRKYHLEKQISQFSTQLENRLQNSTGTAFSTITSVSNSLFSLVTVLVLTFMMLVESPKWLRFLERFIPTKNKSKINELSLQMYQVIKGFVNGQVILALIAAILILPALLILHIGYPAALFFVIFICGLIPMVGHTIGAVIVTSVALFHSLTAGIIIFIYYIIYQQIENYLIQPKLQSNTTNLTPLMVLVALVVGVSFDGLLGGIVAIPIAGCLKILVIDFLRNRKLL